MKRFTLLAVLVLMAAIAIPVMATDFSWSGEVTYGGITDFTNSADAYGNAYLTLKGAADANNTFYAQFAAGFTGSAPQFFDILGGANVTFNAFNTYFSQFYFTSDLGKILALPDPVTAVATFGWIDTSATSYSVTAYGYESLIAYDPQGARDNAQFVIGFGAPLSLQISFSPLSPLTVKQLLQPQVIVDAYGSAGPISYSVAYTTNKRTDYMGLVGASVKWGQAMGDITPAVNAEVSYDLNKSAATAGVGVKVAYTTLVTGAVGMAINVSPTFSMGNLSIETEFVPMTGLGIDVDASLNLGATGSVNIINGIDASVWYLLGKSKLRVGYLYTTTTSAASGNLNGPTTLSAGGLYFSWDLTF